MDSSRQSDSDCSRHPRQRTMACGPGCGNTGRHNHSRPSRIQEEPEPDWEIVSESGSSAVEYRIEN
eukprot:11188434-Lingulodinium_polyedra.AAC.1